MAREGVFAMRRGSGGGVLPPPSELILPRSIRAATLSRCTFQPNASANCGAPKMTPNDRRGACGGAGPDPNQRGLRQPHIIFVVIMLGVMLTSTRRLAILRPQ